MSDATGVQITRSRDAHVLEMEVSRALPHRARRTIGAWCFIDHMLPADPGDGGGIGPHPHIGLQTVTWLLDGEVVHHDSLGNHALLRPGGRLMFLVNGLLARIAKLKPSLQP